MAGRLDGKVAVVTGGASGIGRAIVDAFLAQGAQVVVADISGDQDAVAQALGPNASPFQVDVTSSAAVIAPDAMSCPAKNTTKRNIRAPVAMSAGSAKDAT